MSTIPNGISSDDLKALMATAHVDDEIDLNENTDEPTVETRKGSFTQSEIEALADAADEELFSICPHPIAHKVLIIQILDKMIQWHEQTSLQKLSEDEAFEAAGWAADAGKLHAVKTLLESVSFGSQDFTC